MNENDQPAGEEPRTVFNPGTGFVAPPPPAATPPTADPWGTAPEPEGAPPQLPELSPAPPPMQPPAAAPFTPQQTMASFASPRPEARPIQIGDVLNHIFQVNRLVARGGMGEVFEGINVNTEERVAIKVILPHLAADPSVQAMFRKEARTLTRLSHPALVQYRVLAQEPVLGVFYIVTEYIDGLNLSNTLKDIHPGVSELSMLARRLADGLAAAHSLGAIHRDISPDNVLLEDGRLERAKVIDFGIAKDLDAGSGTIVGDGFAGKLNYVAPEQLGDFNREVGPWTDVYSLGLTLLAVASGRNVDMGATLVDAVDKRRAGPDLTPVPEPLRPVFAKMLHPNPLERARSMEEVIDLLARVGTGPAEAAAPAAPSPSAARGGEVVAPKRPAEPDPARSTDAKGEGKGKSRLPLFAALGAVTVLALVGGGYALIGGKPPTADASNPAGSAAAPADPVAATREVLASGLDGVSCAWLDVANVESKGGAIAIALRGVAGKPAQAQAEIGKLLTQRGLQAGTLDFDDVSPIDANECAPLEAFRKIRLPGIEHVSVPQRSFQLVTLGPDAGADAGKTGVQVPLEVDINGIADDVSVVGLEPSGEMTQIISTKRDLTDTPAIAKPKPGVYRIPINTTHAGWSGILLLSGKAPFDAALLSGPAGSHSGDWSQRFLALADQRGWKAQMVWYRTTK